MSALNETVPPLRNRRLRIDLGAEAAAALKARADRNDRTPYLEAGRIIREALERDGDLTPKPQVAAGAPE